MSHRAVLNLAGAGKRPLNLSHISEQPESQDGAAGDVYSHDDFGRITTKTSPSSGSWSYTYDADGDVTSITDPNGNITTKTYDALNRLMTSTSVGATTESMSWTYDNPASSAFGIGRLWTMTDPTGNFTYSYEPRGKLAQKTQSVATSLYSTPFTNSYSYDADGDLATYTMPSGRAVTYAYDYAHRPVSVSGVYNGVSQTYVSNALYLPFGPRAQLSYGNGVTQVWTYNQRYLPFQDLITRPSGTVASNRLYAEDNLGQVTQITDPPNPQYDRSLSYGGTAILPTMLASVTTGTALWGTASYTTANPQQNFVNAEDLVAESIGSTSLALTYDSNDHLTGIATNGAASAPVTIDAAGNQTTLNATTYSFSPRNLMASGGGFTFGYDGFGKRLTTQKSTNFEVSFYEGNSLTSESAYNSASIAYDYIWFGDTPVAQETLGTTPVTFWTHTNELGAPFLQTTSTGATEWYAEYSPYGGIYALRSGSPTQHQPLRLPGHEALMFPSATTQNGSSQLYYNQNRWYVPGIGRYLTPDPLGFAADPFNQYAYTSNDPTNEIDPSGSSPWDFANGALDYSTFGLTDFAGKGNTDYSGPSYQTGVGIGFVAGLFYGGTEWYIAGAIAKIGSRLAINGGRFEANELSSGSRFACPHVGEPQETPPGAGLIYRTGSTTDNSLTDTAGVSFRSSISSSSDKVQVFKPGEKIYAVDTGLLPIGSVTYDNIPFGHVSVFASPDQIRSSIIPQGAGNPLFDAGINPLQDGFSYGIPK